MFDQPRQTQGNYLGCFYDAFSHRYRNIKFTKIYKIKIYKIM